MLSAFTVILSAVPTASIVFPDFVKPAPAVTWPAPENCAKVSAVVPRVIVSFVERTQPLSAFTVPSATKVNIPLVTSAEVSASVEREATPVATTT